MNRILAATVLAVFLWACNNNATTQPTDRDVTANDSGRHKADTTLPDSILHRPAADSTKR